MEKSASYENEITEYLSRIHEPADVEKIRRACGIGNWLTALTHCLLLMVGGKIKGQRTSKGWIFWIHPKIDLKPYEEAIGTYEGLSISENEVTLTLSINKIVKLTFPKQSLEANILINALKDIQKGTKITLLRTDSPTKPLIIRAYKTEATTDDGYMQITSEES